MTATTPIAPATVTMMNLLGVTNEQARIFAHIASTGLITPGDRIRLARLGIANVDAAQEVQP